MKIVYLLSLLLLLASCGEPIEKEKIIGRYVWSDGKLDTLEIRADGTYEYWAFTPGQKIANSGKWNYNSAMNEVEFELENFPFIPTHTAGRSWYSRAKLKDGEIQLIYTDHQVYLRHVKSSEDLN